MSDDIPAATITPDAAAAVYLAYIAGENARDRAAMARCLSPDLRVSINGVAQLADRDADAEATDRLLAAYPDYERVVRHLAVGIDTAAGSDGGDAVVVTAQWTMRGAANDAAGVPALDVAGCTIATVDRVEGDLVITEAALYTDRAALDHIL